MAKPPLRCGNLPAEATSFIGRRRELAEIKKKLAEARLVSLVGPGGVGKTRLAVRAASELARRFPDGAWLVELAEVGDPALVGNAVMAALDLRDQAATSPRTLLLSFLRDKRLLLLLDNSEHLLAAVAELASEVLKGAAGVRIVATSREPLGVPGEHVVPVAPLELPPVHASEPLARLRQNESVALFAERAAAASGAFELASSNRAAVVELCRRLDGLPLAIELAAVRTRALSLEQIVHLLSDRFDLLTRGNRGALPRHQTLRATIDWSYDLLSVAERALLGRLCVFAGRFTLEDVDGVCAADDGQALELLSSLVDKSLVIREDARAGACYRLHETMREYALLKLREAGEEQAVENRCAEYYRSRSRRFGNAVRYHLPEWLEWMDLEIDNVRSVLRRCVARRDLALGLELASSMSWYWITRATAEGVRWLDQLLHLQPVGSAAYGSACFTRGFLSVLQGDSVAAQPWLERAVAAATEDQDSALAAHSLAMASVAERMNGDSVTAGRRLKEAQTIALSLDDPAASLAVLQARAINGLFDGDLDAVRSATSKGVELAREVGDLYALEVMLGELAGTALIAGDVVEARLLYAEGLPIARQIDDRVTQSYFVNALAFGAARSGQARLAAQLLGAAETMQRTAGARVLAFMIPLVTEAEESASAALGASRFKAELEAGRQLSREAAVRLALGEPEPVALDASSPAGAGLLARRESDVARLVADGLSNKEIGARLFISQRTVDSHVRNILNKLGFNTRAQIAAWMASGR